MDSSKVSSIVAERGKVYGPPESGHTNIGLAWTALLQAHYGTTLAHPIPASLVATMMVALKCIRATRVYHEDNYTDGQAYLGFAEQFQRNESAEGQTFDKSTQKE